MSADSESRPPEIPPVDLKLDVCGDTPPTSDETNKEPNQDITKTEPKTDTPGEKTPELEPNNTTTTSDDEPQVSPMDTAPPPETSVAQNETKTTSHDTQSTTSDGTSVDEKERDKQEQPETKQESKAKREETRGDYLTRFKACMLLSGVGDALGYKNGAYEFCRNGAAINGEVKDKGGVENIKVDARNWMVSDDTVMHIATAEALVSKWGGDYEKLYLKLAEKYKECMRDMSGRAPGNTCMTWTHQLRPKVPKGYVIPFNPRGGGCGAAMRAVPIGLYFNREDQLNELVAVSIESGRMTHNHPTGYLGALAVALFVSYAFQRKPLVEWGAGLLQTLDIAWEYIKKEGRDVEDNKHHWSYFKDRWTEYVTIRRIEDGRSPPTFPDPFDAKERDNFNKYISFSGWGGSSGHDAPMIAYDALLGCEYNVAPECAWSWAELCSRGMFHGGDSDSTGIIAAACWGAMRGFEGVPKCNYEKLEYRDRLEKLGKQIYEKVSK